MRNSLAFFPVAIISVMAAAPASAETLWQNTSVGMSPTDVMNLYPDTKPTTLSGNEALIKSGRVTIFDTAFLVSFEFNTEKLFRVNLSASNISDNNALSSPLVTYKLVANELIKRYGRPNKVQTDSVIAGETQYFLKDGVSIKLNYMQFDTYKSISIRYESSTGGENPL